MHNLGLNAPKLFLTAKYFMHNMGLNAMITI